MRGKRCVTVRGTENQTSAWRAGEMIEETGFVFQQACVNTWLQLKPGKIGRWLAPGRSHLLDQRDLEDPCFVALAQNQGMCSISTPLRLPKHWPHVAATPDPLALASSFSHSLFFHRRSTAGPASRLIYKPYIVAFLHRYQVCKHSLSYC